MRGLHLELPKEIDLGIEYFLEGDDRKQSAMKKKRFFLFFSCLIAIAFFSCDGNNGNNQSEKGIIVVLSNPEGASVLINGTLKSGTTPVSFELDPGKYTVKARKTGYIPEPESIVVNLAEGETDTALFELREISDTAYVFVSANYLWVPIFIDGIPSGFHTPALIAVSPGNHSILVDGFSFRTPASRNIVATRGDTVFTNFALEFRRCALIEEFTHVNCVNCPDVASAVHAVLDATGDSLVFLEWHPQQSGGIDPFRQDNPALHDGRVLFYDFVGIPRVFVAGQMVPTPTSVSAIQTFVNNALSGSSRVHDFKIWGHEISRGSVFLAIVGVSGYDANGVIKVVCVETHRHYSTAPGTNGMTDFYDVPRRMTVEPSTGTMTIPHGEPRYFTLSVEIPADLSAGQYKIIAWFEKNDDGVFGSGDVIHSPCILD